MIFFHVSVLTEISFCFEINLFPIDSPAKYLCKLNYYYYYSALIKTFSLLFQANGEASLGKYVEGSVVGAGANAGLFVANHAY